MSIESRASQPINNLNDKQIAIIGKNFSLKGDFTGTAPVVIGGKMEGNLTATQVILEEGSVFLGNIICEKIDLSGAVQGNIETIEAMVRKSAVIEGDLSYSILSIESGGAVLGKLKRVTQKNVAVTPVARSQASAITRIDFSRDLCQKLRLNNEKANAHLTLVDGNIIPPWIYLTQDKLGVLAETDQLKSLEKEGAAIEMRLHVGQQYFDFTLPVQN